MKKEEFYQKYANTPIPDRFKSVLVTKRELSAFTTLSEIYDEVKLIDDKIRQDEIRRKELVDFADQIFNPIK